MGIFDWLFGGKKTTTPEKKETIVKKITNEISETNEGDYKSASAEKLINVKISQLNLEIKLSDLVGDEYKENEIQEIQDKLFIEGHYDDGFLNLKKEKNSYEVEGYLNEGDFEIINVINSWKIFEKDPFIMIVKDAYFGEGDDDGYIFFEGFGCDDPPTLKGGEYDKKSFMSSGSKEFKKMLKLLEDDDIRSDVKYQDIYFERKSKYNPEEWIKNWLSKDYGHNKS